jgi:hypothetical protein
MDAYQHRLDHKWTANDSFAAFGRLLDLDPTLVKSMPFGNFDRQKVTEALRQSEMAEGKSDVLPDEQLLHYIPIGFQEVVHGVLPAELVHDVPYQKIIEVLIQV